MKRRLYSTLMALALSAAVGGCTGARPEQHEVETDGLSPCPDRRNCVSSAARDERHAVASMQLKGDSETGWAAVRKAVNRLPRSEVVAASDRYLHVLCKSRLFRFIDDLELLLDPQTGEIGVRSAARVGYFDLGVNRRRVEALRRQLKSDGIIR